ncbi:MAG TPA: hypothetical protein VGK67_21510 [Myxococcales bacterium]|jgi:hypothetical protein
MTRIHGKPQTAIAQAPKAKVAAKAEAIREACARALDHVTDSLDEFVGLDAKGAKPITLTGVKDSDFALMQAKVDAMERGEPALTDAQRQKLDRGEILSSWNSRPDGLVEELTRGVVDLPLEKFLEKIPMKDWGVSLADYRGGEVVPAGQDRQIERMVLRMPGKDLDMTKVETLHEKKDASGKLQGTQVKWEVLKSDNGTTLADVGTLRFERCGDKTLVTFHSAHKLDKFPALTALMPQKVKDAATGEILKMTFTKHVENYRKLAGAR